MKLNTSQAYTIVGGGLLGVVVAFNVFTKALASYTPKSTHSGEWKALTDKYMHAQDMSPMALGYTPSYLKKKAE